MHTKLDPTLKAVDTYCNGYNQVPLSLYRGLTLLLLLLLLLLIPLLLLGCGLGPLTSRTHATPTTCIIQARQQFGTATSFCATEQQL
jgi:hypothetical protein